MKKIITAIRPALLSLVAIFFAGIITTVFHLIFTPFLGPFPQEELMSADWAGKVAVMDAYMEANPFAVYSALIAHGMGAFAGVFFVTRSNRTYDLKNGVARPQWIAPLIVAGFWMYADVQNDLFDAPIGPAWTAMDVAVTAILSFIGYLLAGGGRKNA
jgi:hypothetical protein